MPSRPCDVPDEGRLSRQAAHKRFRAPDEWRGERFLPQPCDDGGDEPGLGQAPQDGDRV